MTSRMAMIAKELLALEEKRAGDEELTEEEERRWQLLAKDLFQPGDFWYKRRSFRLPVSIEARILHQRESRSCTLGGVSLLGFSCTTEFTGFGTGDRFLLQSVLHDGQEVEINLKCEVVRRLKEKPSVFGVIICDDNTAEVRRRYSREVHYFLFLRYLNSLVRDEADSGGTKEGAPA